MMQLAIARYRKYAVASAVFASLALIGATGTFPGLVRFGVAALESYNAVTSDAARNFFDHLNSPTVLLNR